MIFSRDVEKVREITDSYQKDMTGFEASEWLSHEENLAVTDGENWSLFEKGKDGVYTGHYFFVSRGKQAVSVAREMLSFIFNNSDIRTIRGLTPLSKLGARWLSRKIGFEGHGIVFTETGPCELFIISKEV